jgi:hypothetical protein
LPVAERRPRRTRNSWTCERCQVNVSWMPGSEAPEQPAGWSIDKHGTYCLLCRRSLAADEALAQLPETTPRDKRAKARTTALIEFEILRDPERGNGEIARVVRSSVPAVAKARERLEIPEPSRN